MTRPTSRTGPLLLVLIAFMGVPVAQTADRDDATPAGTTPSEQNIDANAKAGHFSFVLFYRSNDDATQSVYKTLKSEAAKRNDASILPVRVNDPTERRLVERFDATRTPLPAVVAIAPNGAVTGVFSQRIEREQVDGAIVTPGYAECLKAMQNNRIVLLCVQPEVGGFIPKGVQQFQADREFHKRTQLVTIRANDVAEAKFLRQLKLKSDAAAPQVVFMAPPGVLLGTYDAGVTRATLTAKLVAAGKCCTDQNCKHHRTASGASSKTNR